jgi:MFS family permease
VTLALACVLGLNAADVGALGALAPTLDRELGLTNADIGLLRLVTAATAAALSLPAGVLADRARRTRLLAVSAGLWALATIAAGSATSFGRLLLARVGLGVAAAAAGPVIASLVGDYFPVADRGRVYGTILTGELAGAGCGLLIAGNVSAALSWRWALWALAPPAFAVAAWARRLPEPARGGTSMFAAPAASSARPAPAWTGQAGRATGEDGPGEAGALAHAHGIQPDHDLLRGRRPEDLSLAQAVRYVLRVPTNVVLIVSSALGYFFFTGLQTFATSYLHDRSGLGQGTAATLLVGIGAVAVAGVAVGGRLGDRLLAGGRLTGRVQVLIGAYLLATAALLPAFLSRSLAAAVPLFAVAAFGLGAANPPLDAARLDIMPAPLWGRAEAIRGALRTAADAASPLLFGLLADTLAGPHGVGLQRTFLLMLTPMAAGGLLAVAALRTYPRDVATAAHYQRRPR